MLTLALLAAMLAEDPFTAGRALYRGERPVTARLADSEDPLPAPATACKNCHGEWAEGGREAGVEVAPINWHTLTRGPQPRYNQTSFCRAVREGVGANGHALSRAMPRYTLNGSDCQALWQYLRVLDEAPLHGLSSDRVGVAIVAGVNTQQLSAVAQSLASAFASVNARGGLWGRRLELVQPTEASILLVLEGRAPSQTSPQMVVIRWQADPPDSSSLIVSPSPEAYVRSALLGLSPNQVLLAPAVPWTSLWRDTANALGWRVFTDAQACPASPVVLLAERVAAIHPATLAACRGGGTVLFRSGPFPARSLTPAHKHWKYFRLLPQAPLDQPTLAALAGSIHTALEASGRRALHKDVEQHLRVAFRARSGETSRLAREAYAIGRDGSLIRWPATAGER